MAGRVRAAIYCRLSRKGGRSVERQEQEGRRIAKQKGWDVAAVYKEIGSASPHAKKGREEWDKLLAAIERKEYDAVIFWMEDRSARDVTAAGEFVQACKKAGLKDIVLPSYDYDLTDPEHVARFYGEVLHGQQEAAKLSKRVKSARKQEAGQGWPHPGGKRAFGEAGGRRVRDPDKEDDDPEKWLTDKDGKWLRAGAVPAAQVEAERKLIREAGRRLIAGDSNRGIVSDWNQRELRGTSGERWTTRSLKRMMLSPRLVGLRDHEGRIVTNGDGEPVRLMDGPGLPAEPILPLSTWKAVCAILTDPSRNTTAATAGRPARRLLSGRCYCGVCKAKLRADRDHKTGEPVYVCPPRSDGGRRCVSRSAVKVEDLILRALFRAVENPAWEEAAAERPNGDPTRPHYERLAELTAELDVLDRRIAETELAEELGRKPRPSSATLRRMAAEREDERERHQAAVTRLQHGRVASSVPRNLRTIWPSLSLDRQRAIVAAVIERIEIHPQGQKGRSPVFDADAIKIKRRG